MRAALDDVYRRFREAKQLWFADAVGDGARDVHRRMKAALDPLGILNPGKFVP